MMDKLTIVIPSYNEADNLPQSIPPLIDFCIKNQCRLIVVNDGSKDNSKEILLHLSHPQLLVIHHKVNKGYGGALKTGVDATQTEFIITVDADGQHYTDDIENLFREIVSSEADMVVGSRKANINKTNFRRIGKWLIRKLVHFFVSKDVWDINSGMKIYRTELLKKYLHICPDSMAFSDIITLIFLNQRHLVIEKDIKIKSRIGGQSTININTAFQTIYEILNIVMLFNPIKIFFPFSAILFFIGFFWGLPIIIVGKGISTGASMLIVLSFFSFLMGLIAEQLSLLLKKK